MDEIPKRWGLTFPGPQGAHGEQTVIAVHLRAGETGPHGHPLYTDDRGVLAEITADGVVFLLDSDGLPEPGTPPHAHPLL
ncbi:DUF6296 family protein [Kitasatospora sp. NPDC056531]|uniref:DUF6296 family protein n=1 Tax=Kitasatospora sp. NPDC056531 TaxID=3345856 RepID=UPI0036778DCC